MFQARVASSIVGAATVPLVALVGRRLAGARVGIVAAALTAVWPFLIATDGSLMSETIAVPLVTAALLATLWAHDARRLSRWAVVGVLFALAALARAEAPLLMVIVIGAALLATRELSARMRLGPGRGRARQASALVSAPWVGYVVHEVGVGGLWATDSAKTLAGANCQSTYYGPEYRAVGQRVHDSGRLAEAHRTRGRVRQPSASTAIRARAPDACAARRCGSCGRATAGLYAPRQQHDFEVIESRHAKWQTLAWWCYLALLPFAAYGLVVLIRRRRAAVVVGRSSRLRLRERDQ